MVLEIETVIHLTGQDKEDLASIVEGGLGKSLVSDYYSGCFDPLCIYFAGENSRQHGAAVVLGTDIGAVYIDKFVVLKEKHRNGFGSHLAEAVKKDHPKGFLRVKKDNPANAFYEKVFGRENLAESAGWNVYHWGLCREEIDDALIFADKKPETLKPMAAQEPYLTGLYDN